MGNKKYVLGNYELGSLEIHLLTDAITSNIECNTDYLEKNLVQVKYYLKLKIIILMICWILKNLKQCIIFILLL